MYLLTGSLPREHLLGTCGRLQTLKGMGGIPTQPGRMWKGRRWGKKGGGRIGPAPLTGGLREKRYSHTQRGPLTVRGSAGMERDF